LNSRNRFQRLINYDNIKVDLEETTGCEVVDLINVALDGDKWQIVVSVVMNPQV